MPRVVQRTGLDVNAGRPVKLGIRPEHIAIAREVGEVHPTPAGMFAFEATGPETLFTLNLGPNLVTVRAPTDATTADIDLADGAVAGLRIDPTWLYIFDAASGETLAQAPAARADEDAKVVPHEQILAGSAHSSSCCSAAAARYSPAASITGRRPPSPSP